MEKLRQNCGKSNVFIKSRQSNTNLFGICHYAGKVRADTKRYRFLFSFFIRNPFKCGKPILGTFCSLVLSMNNTPLNLFFPSVSLSFLRKTKKVKKWHAKARGTLWLEVDNLRAGSHYYHFVTIVSSPARKRGKVWDPEQRKLAIGLRGVWHWLLVPVPRQTSPRLVQIMKACSQDKK